MIPLRPAAFLLAALLPVAGPAPGCWHAAMAQEVVQQLPGPAHDALADALRRLSRNPENVAALVDAGHASLALGDVPAALGFFNRAQARRPEDEAVLTGLALVAVRRGEGTIAVQLFDNANAAGAALSGHAAERGLAYDLIGNNARAQRLYRQALARQDSDEVTRRLALSYAISGDGAASEATLLPLLQRQDRSAWRSRAFALAILGRDVEAITIAETMLPPRLSLRLIPYLRHMPQLTRAQQAAAANLGRFPAAADIGRDDVQIAAVASDAGEAAAAPPARGDRLTPSGAPLGNPAASAAPAAPPAASGELPALASSQPDTLPPSARDPAGVANIENAPQQMPEARPSIALDTPAPPPPQVAVPVGEHSAGRSGTQSEDQIDLAEAFADFALPADGLPVAPVAGAVDVTAIEPAREAPPAPAPPPPPAHPSRHWVQVATGQDVSAFRFDWRRIVRNADGLLDGREAYTARWNQTNRLVTGPFESAREANRFVAQLGEAGIDAFRFTSAEGEELRPID